FRVQWLAYLGAAAFLWRILFQHQFHYQYVASYSSRAMPGHYVFAAFWGGQEGTFMLWALFTATLGLVLMRLKHSLTPAAMIFSTGVLATGFIMGGVWAYKVLGWGGYWGWDPVENGSFIPWLSNVALLHGLLIQRVTGSLRRTNFFLAVTSYVLVLYASFLTRSGVLADFSVHSFANRGLSGFLLAFLFVIMI